MIKLWVQCLIKKYKDKQYDYKQQWNKTIVWTNEINLRNGGKSLWIQITKPAVNVKCEKRFKQLTSTTCSFTESKINKCAEKNAGSKIVVLYCNKRMLEINVL